MNLTLTVQRLEDSKHIPTDAQFSQWLETTLTGRKESAEICIRLVGNDESAELNQQYRQKKGPTNVLSFNSALPPALAEHYLLGDLVICVPLVAEEAAAERITELAHWAHLVIHGCLHLLGYDHELDNDAEIMEKLETEIMLQLDFTDPYGV
ncbi:MAG: rRNA maturation RNase YbeY [Gammaproteobacteria bacterium]